MDEEKLKPRIELWFQERLKTHPEIATDGRFGAIMPIAVRRVAPFILKLEHWKLTLQTDEALKELKAQTYYVSMGYPNAVFALYDDDSLLWLDDHTSDTAFETFIERENLPMPDADKMAAILLQTKFRLC